MGDGNPARRPSPWALLCKPLRSPSSPGARSRVHASKERPVAWGCSVFHLLGDFWLSRVDVTSSATNRHPGKVNGVVRVWKGWS